MRFLILFVALLNFASIADAAEITARPKNKHGSYMGIFAIEGKIEKGDYVKFKDAIERYGHSYNSVTIASKGGELLEAMKIGRLIRKLKFGTDAPFDAGIDMIISFDVKDKSNDVCVGSCFFIYVAGVNRGGNIIGIQRPFIHPDDYKKMKVGGAKEKQQKIKAIVAGYLEEMNVPSFYANRLFSNPKDVVKWLYSKETHNHLSGFIPEMDEWLKNQCPSLTDIEAATKNNLQDKGYKNWIKSEKNIMKNIQKKDSQIFHCRYKKHQKVSCKAWATYVGKSVSICERS